MGRVRRKILCMWGGHVKVKSVLHIRLVFAMLFAISAARGKGTWEDVGGIANGAAALVAGSFKVVDSIDMIFDTLAEELFGTTA